MRRKLALAVWAGLLAVLAGPAFCVYVPKRAPDVRGKTLADARAAATAVAMRLQVVSGPEDGVVETQDPMPGTAIMGRAPAMNVTMRAKPTPAWVQALLQALQAPLHAVKTPPPVSPAPATTPTTYIPVAPEIPPVAESPAEPGTGPVAPRPQDEARPPAGKPAPPVSAAPPLARPAAILPCVLGMQPADAIQTITSAHLLVQTNGGSMWPARLQTVTTQSPTCGERLPRRSAVVLSVGLNPVVKWPALVLLGLVGLLGIRTGVRHWFPVVSWEAHVQETETPVQVLRQPGISLEWRSRSPAADLMVLRQPQVTVKATGTGRTEG